MLFDGLADWEDFKVNKLSITARAVKIHPANDPSLGEPDVALRVEFYTCPPCGPTTKPATIGNNKFCCITSLT